MPPGISEERTAGTAKGCSGIHTTRTGLLAPRRFHPIGRPAFSLAAFRSSSTLDQGVWAEVKVGGEHLRLFSEESALGVQATVYNMNARNWIAPSETVEDIEQGKDRAANMLGRTLEGRQLRTTFVNSEEILLGVVSAALIHALSNPANQFF